MAGANKKINGQFYYLIELFAALLGVVVSIYLFVHHVRLTSGLQEGASFCSFGKFADCDSVNVSQFSELFGIPIAAFGALAYFVIFLLGLSSRPSDPGFRFSQRLVGIIGSICLIVDAALFIVQLAVIRNFCLFCLLTYAASFVVLLAAVKLNGGGKRGLAGYNAALATSGPIPAVAVRWLTGVGIVIFALSLWLLPATIRIQSQTYAFVTNAVEQFFAQFAERPGKKIDIVEGDGVYGNPNAKVTIVEFSDFECPHCQKAAFTMHTALKVLGDRAQFVFKHFPLDSACNTLVKRQIHPNACALARLGYCAAKKNQFWEYHDRVFFNWSPAEKAAGPGALDKAVASNVFKGIFTASEVQRCLSDEVSLQAVRTDIQVGDAVGVKGTPAVYVNGKSVNIPVTLENLKRLVDIENRP